MFTKLDDVFQSNMVGLPKTRMSLLRIVDGFPRLLKLVAACGVTCGTCPCFVEEWAVLQELASGWLLLKGLQR